MISKVNDPGSQAGRNNESSQRLCWERFRSGIIDISVAFSRFNQRPDFDINGGL